MFDFSVKEILGFITLLIVIPQVLLYFRSIIKGETKPHIYTKIIWFILTGIAFAIQISGGAGPGAWVLGATSITQLITIFFGFKYGIARITKFDTLLLVLALLCIPVYLGVENKIFALVLVIFIDFLGYIPTYRKTFISPYTENLTVWIISNTKYFIAMLALLEYSYYTMAYPLFLFLANLVLIFIIYFRRKVIKKSPTNGDSLR